MMRRRMLSVLVLLAACTDAAQQAPLEPAMSRAQSSRWIVVMDPGADPTPVIRAHGLRPTFIFHHALTGFVAELPDRAAVARDRRVRGVYPDLPVHLDAVPSWGLDRIDQRFLPLDGVFAVDRTGSGVRAYVIDSGLRSTHVEFTGRVSPGTDLIADGLEDCLGHGTHVSGTIGGATYGVARSVILVPVRVFGCGTTSPTSTIIAGAEWVLANAVRPAVVNMSLGGGLSLALNEAVQNMISAGLSVVVSAGNSSVDACTQSPAVVPAAVTVGATQANDWRSGFSNFGPCVDLFAPGSGIVSAWNGSDTDARSASGTSMSAPHVTGIAALVLGEQPGASPAQVATTLTATATKGVVQDARSDAWHLAYSGRDVDDRDVGPPPVPPPPPTLVVTVVAVKGYRDARLDWQGLVSDRVTIWDQYGSRPGLIVDEVDNTGTYLYVAQRKGKKERYNFRVCEVGRPVCTPFISVML